MASVQITDLNSSKSELLYELSDDEILDINGGGLLGDIVGVVMIVAACFTSPVIGVALIGGGVNLINGGSNSSSGGGGNKTPISFSRMEPEFL